MDAGAKIRGMLAIAAMAAGVVLYVIDRPVPHVYLLPSVIAFAGSPGTIPGAISASLPSFVHVYAFSLLTAAVAGSRSTRSGALIAGAWCAIDVLFELGQHTAFAPHISGAMPAWFGDVPLLENIGPYFLRGTFDPADLVATVAGAIVAYLSIVRFPARRECRECQSQS